MRNRRLSAIHAVVAAALAVLLPAPAPAVDATFLPLKDNTLYEPIMKDNLELRSNGAGESMFVGRVKDAVNADGQVAVRRSLLAFDVSSIPAGATIDFVTLTLTVTKAAQNATFTVNLHRATSDWGEGASDTGNAQQGRGATPATGDATWEHTFFDTQIWATDGGDFDSSSSAMLPVGGTGSYTWGSTSGMIADVQFWVDNPAQNFGWVIVGNENQVETSKQFATKENGDNAGASRPMLFVQYTTGVISGACCQGETCTVETPADCLTLGGVYQGDFTSCSPSPCVDPVGACCADDGTCTDQIEADCLSAGGTWQGAGSSCATAECPIELTPYVDALPIPVPATPVSGTSGGAATYGITMKEFTQQLHGELPPTTVWGYDDGFTGPLFPGPTIEARTGEPVTVDWINGLADASGLRVDHYLDVDVQTDSEGAPCIHGAQDLPKTVVHLHGGHVPAEFDGYPEDTYLPGMFDTYVYPNGQQAGYLWYHDHALGITRLNVYMGLAGLYLVRDDVEDALGLPACTGGGSCYEVPLVLQDRKFHPDGTLRYPSAWQDHWFGDKVVVNGKVWPFLDVDQGKYRFRVLGGSGSRVYTLRFDGPGGTVPFTVIGTEGGLLEAPVPGVTELTVGPGERYDIVFDFEPFSAGDEIFLENGAPAPFPNGSVDLPTVMKFVVGSEAGHTAALPASLRSIERLQEGDAVLTRDFELRRSGTDGCGRSVWEINDLHWDDITEYPELDTTEIWRFINDSNVSHPMHMHLVFFQILDRQPFDVGAGGEILPVGTPEPPLPEENGWKDTAMVGPGEIVRVIVRFEDYKGKYAYHCHILEHEDHEMMRQFQTVRCGDAVLDPTESCDDGNKGNLDGCSASCVPEEFLELEGTATGGGGPPRIDVVVSGELIRVSDIAGLTAEQVIQLLADAINANTNLQALGVSATAAGRRLVVTGGSIESVDPPTGLTEVLRLESNPTRLWWGAIGSATAGYDVVTGSANALNALGGNFADPSVTLGCLADDTVDPWLAGVADPAPGEIHWFAVRGQPGGSYDSCGAAQQGSRDTGIGASGHGCP